MAVEQQIEYAIVGGGISGLTLAIALLKRGLSVHIYEQAKEFGEIGAGVSFTPNSVQAMKLCHPGIYDAFERVCTRNLWPSKQGVWFDFYDGLDTDQKASSVFTIRNDLGQNAVHRANFLDELVKLMPEGKASFGKRLDDIIQNEDGRYTLKFLDGSSAIADAVLGCDGIKSKTREIMFGSDHPCVVPSYTFKNAYRAMLPMETAIAAIGKEKAENACMHLGRGAHLLTFPVRHGQMMNVVGFCGTDQPWKDMRKLTAPATREDALRDFAGFGPVVTGLLQLAEPTLEIWGIFDLGVSPPPSYVKDRICLVGDAAHATTPHHGAGAGMCIEDAAVLCALLADERAQTRPGAQAAIATFEAVRKERGDWLVQSSRFNANVYQRQAPGIGDDFAKIEAEINRKNDMVANVNVEEMCREAIKEFSKRL